MRILTIDGGGVFGLLPAQVLSGLERSARRPIAGMFDLVVGTSIGALLALLLACPHSSGGPRYAADEVADILLRRAPEMLLRRPLRRIRCPALALGPLYRSEGLETVLADQLGDTPMTAALTPTVGLAFDMLAPRLIPLRSDASGPCDNAIPLMRHAARACTAAPSYFEPVILRRSDATPEACLIDAGICANHPGLVALREAARLPPAPLSILSLGCGRSRPTLNADRIARWPRARWICPLLQLLTSGSGAVADDQLAGLSESGALRYLRIDADLGPGMPRAFDDPRRSGLRRLHAAGATLFERRRAEIEALLAG